MHPFIVETALNQALNNLYSTNLSASQMRACWPQGVRSSPGGPYARPTSDQRALGLCPQLNRLSSIASAYPHPLPLALDRAVGAEPALLEVGAVARRVLQLRVAPVGLGLGLGLGLELGLGLGIGLG